MPSPKLDPRFLRQLRTVLDKATFALMVGEVTASNLKAKRFLRGVRREVTAVRRKLGDTRARG